MERTVQDRSDCATRPREAMPCNRTYHIGHRIHSECTRDQHLPKMQSSRCSTALHFGERAPLSENPTLGTSNHLHRDKVLTQEVHCVARPHALQNGCTY